MKNVVIHKIVKYIFTEDQLIGYWKRLGEDLDFSSLSNEQLISLAKKLLNETSHSQLEQHIAGGIWRSEEEASGKLLAEDDSEKDVHIELIDTSLSGVSSEKVLIDRFLTLQCSSCSFTFYVEDLKTDTDGLHCPKCQSKVTYA
ncbi:putative Zn-ribbon and HTH transcriptional regulator [Bacillus fengqiuensis]|nr:putative Zn-ribbon and HTH transcriptional regulator [Bacillus fengqiuensis]